MADTRPHGPRTFGFAPDGSPVMRTAITGGGLSAQIITWGAGLQDVRRAGTPHPLVLGSPDLAAYQGPMRYFGAVVGRVANRIAGGTAMLEGKRLTLDRNEDGRTTLHGGTRGTSQYNWRLDGQDEGACRLSLRLPDGEGGFPGAMDLAATYAIEEVAGGAALTLTLEATTDRPTFCNLASHAYWTLDGGPDLSAHSLRIAAGSYLPVDAARIPVAGPPVPVAGTGFDYRAARPLPGPEPLDHNFCLDVSGEGLHPACALSAGGLALEIETTEPGLQVYDAARMDTGAAATLHGRPYGAHAGLALEPQRWPDAPNRPDFPSVALRPGETYRQRSRFIIRAL
ncbi:aldose epimerase family protein [Acidimangrovimonas sediminis]|uniref:aldose epimerase family protein n=1 Tax=Acidimangrovimonas sediminis TaxID=2056283 RepID=UPI000C80C3F7|nr:aldose epimerase family protein [Acidimangrovimonas sediminis]